MTQKTDEKPLTKMEIKDLVQKEISECFRSLVEGQEKQGRAIKVQGEDIKEIKEALIGGSNKYKKNEGLASMIQFSYDYAKANVDSKVVEKALPAINFYYDWSEGEKGKTKWDVLNSVIDDFLFSKRLKLFFGIGSWAGICSLIISIASIISFIVYLVNIGVLK